MVDASVSLVDIAYPTDLNLLNTTREKLDEIINVLRELHRAEIEKPQTYRKLARRDYLRASNKQKLYLNQFQKAIRKQLEYTKRVCKHIDTVMDRYNGLEVMKSSSISGVTSNL
jgi:IS5 family transposase